MKADGLKWPTGDGQRLVHPLHRPREYPGKILGVAGVNRLKKILT
jgi:hypothetical protein